MKRRQDIRYVRVRCPECDRRAEMVAPLLPGAWVHHTSDGRTCPGATAVLDHDWGDR